MSTAIHEQSTAEGKARHLVREMKSRGGLAPVELERFWAEQAVAFKDPFGARIPQVPLGVLMSAECIFDELGIEENFWRLAHDHEWALALKKAYNDKSEAIVGRRLLAETPFDPARQYPPVKGLHNVFEAGCVWQSGSWWLEKSAHGEDGLKALLDRVDGRNIREFILPENWQAEKERLMALGITPRPYRGQRGPVTFAMSVYGIEELIFLLVDNPGLAERFRGAILRTMLEIARVLDEEAGFTAETAPRGFWLCDDNCCMLNREMYEFFGYPILKGLFEHFSPGPCDARYQHSDSPMGHLLPLLGGLGMTGVNFGPTLGVGEIRQHCPKAVIEGQLAPFTFSRNEEELVVLEFLRDFDAAFEERGLVFATAGSINNGSRLTGMRLIMSAIQHYGRYDQ